MKKILQYHIPTNLSNFNLVINESFQYLKIIPSGQKHYLHVLAEMNSKLVEKKYALFVNGVSLPKTNLIYIDTLILSQEEKLISLHLFELLD